MSHVEAYLARSRATIVEHCTRLLAKANLAETERERLQRLLAETEATARIDRAA